MSLDRKSSCRYTICTTEDSEQRRTRFGRPASQTPLRSAVFSCWLHQERPQGGRTVSRTSREKCGDNSTPNRMNLTTACTRRTRNRVLAVVAFPLVPGDAPEPVAKQWQPPVLTADPPQTNSLASTFGLRASSSVSRPIRCDTRSEPIRCSAVI